MRDKKEKKTHKNNHKENTKKIKRMRRKRKRKKGGTGQVTRIIIVIVSVKLTILITMRRTNGARRDRPQRLSFPVMSNPFFNLRTSLRAAPRR